MSDSVAAGRTPGLAIENGKLTPEQRRIVEHEDGPALVFAVAGAGKTTSMVHRIRRLVSDGASPRRILASSFSRSTVDDLERGLLALGVEGVQCRTIHSLGRSFIADAERRGHRPRQLQNGEVDPASMARILAGKARTQLAMERSIDTSALGIPQSDLEDRISAWKTCLAYADLDATDLPPEAREQATQAEHENEDFLTLYRYAERLRQERGWITFDDMLRDGWEVLMRHDDVRAAAQGQFDYVLVDEFQDVSPVQVRLLDVVTESHRNYMAIGDDDQCIYEWRGADPSFILGFADRYDASEYVISDNFRSTGQQTSLANAVIGENRRRHPKRLHPTRTFDGHTHMRAGRGQVGQARDLVAEIQSHLDAGAPPSDLVILVRQYAQTPFIEQALIRAQIPYRIVGSSPFYLRTQVQALLRHLFFAMLDRQVREHGWFEDGRRVRQYLDRFEKVMLEPNRYVSGSVLTRIRRRTRRKRASVLDVLRGYRGDMHARTARGIDDFLDVMAELRGRLDEPAEQTVDWLIDAMGYEGYIRQHSAFKETADDRIRTARSLVHFAQGIPSTRALLERIKQISFDRMEHGPSSDCLEIRSIHRAKGGEWPVVFVPDCNDGTIPNLTGMDAGSASTEDRSQKQDASDDGSSQNASEEGEPSSETGDDEPEGEAHAETIEGERRLFYVAITRAMDELYLFRDESEPISPFLEGVDAERVLEQCDHCRQVLHAPIDEIDTSILARFCLAVDGLQIDRFLLERWTPHRKRFETLRDGLSVLEDAISSAKERVSEYSTAQNAYERKKAEVLDPISEDLDHLREKKFVLPAVEVPIAYDGTKPEHWVGKPVRFEKRKGEFMVVAGSVSVGRVAFDRDTEGVAEEAVGSLAPDALCGDVQRASSSGETLYVSIDVGATRRRLQSARRRVLQDLHSPETPDDTTRRLASTACYRGRQKLLRMLETVEDRVPDVKVGTE
ncbi:MAG: UvrD-helicase domain-containing protein [Bacteroidetes bacterium]|jgi:DNA helicase-2/ATP-dependent DNA helicase PcrA|nr:UvrD-helicase domain-containing protein [Bacteroidota bacterium]